MARILFYAPFNQRSRDTESLMLAFKDQGHNVTCLSQHEGFLINDFLNERGVTALSHVVPGRRSGWRYYYRHLVFFVKFCRKNNIDVVYSHLESANFVASLGQYFIKGKTYLCRHHADQYKMLNLNRNWSYRITYWLARHIIVYSDSTRAILIGEERVPSHRILRINLAYDFSLYSSIRPKEIEKLKSKYQADVLLMTVGSFLPLKRPEMSIRVLKAIKNKGIDAKLVLLGKGELEQSLRELAGTLGLVDCVFFAGYVDNVLEHLAVSSFVLHPSLSEASCVCIKEAGLVQRPVIVCRDVGDFKDYISHSENGFLVDEKNYIAEASEIIQQYGSESQKLRKMGELLKDSVIKHFDIKNVLPYYDSINRG